MNERNSTPRQARAGGAVHPLRAAFGFACLGFAAALAGPLVAQEELPGIFSDVIDVRVVNLEIVVTDRAGNRVSGLSAADFRLLVDGKEVPVEYFNEVLGGSVVPAGGSEAPVAAGVPSLTPGRPVGTSYLVFVDDFFALERDRNRVLDALRDEVPLLNPEDRLAIVAYDGKRLSMLSSWSQSAPTLERALKQAALRPAYGLQRLAEQRRYTITRGAPIYERSLLNNRVAGARLTPEERDYAEVLTNQVKNVISAASATLRSFAQPPGRKVMLLLAGGWPFDPTQAVSEDPDLPILDNDFDRGYELFRSLADTANLLGYTLYPIDVPGLQGTAPQASEQLPAAPGSPALLSAEQEVHGSLNYLARRTGGMAMIDSNRGKALGQAASDTRSYYWLGFSPQRQRDDKPHRIKVEARRPGLRVRSRAGFLDFSRQAEVSAQIESTLLFGSAPPQGVLPVQLGAAKKAGGGRMEVPITVAIPVASITVLPIGDRFVAELELRVAALDEDGNTSDIPVIPLKLESDKQPAAGGMIRYDTSVKLRRKKQDLVVSIFDPASGHLLANRLELSP